MRKHKEHRPTRRLLQHLENSIGGAAVHVIGGIDDDDAPAFASRRLPEEFARAAHFIHGDRGLELAALGVEGPRDVQQVVRGSGDDLSESRECGIRIGDSLRSMLRLWMCKYVIGEAESERRLADALRSFDQDRMMALAGAIGTRKKIL